MKCHVGHQHTQEHEPEMARGASHVCQDGGVGQHFRISAGVCGHMIMHVSVECAELRELLSQEGALRIRWLTLASRALPGGPDSGQPSTQGSIYGTGYGVIGE